MANQTVEVLVIGAGPGGYVAAIRAAQLGKQVVCVEREALGGACLNVGCIPSKALISAAKLAEKMSDAGAMGITAHGIEIDLAKMQSWKDGIVKKLTSGVAHLFKGNGVTHITGEARFVSPHAVELRSRVNDAPSRIEFDSCIVATGSQPVEIPGFPFDGREVLDSTAALALTEIPKRLCVIGGGTIGLELGTMFAKLGSQLTVVEMTEQLLPGTDPELVGVVERRLKKKGATVHVKSRVLGVERGPTGLRVTVETTTGPKVIDCDKVVVAVGRRPSTQGLDLEKAGVRADAKGTIPVDAERRTNVPHIFAVGDVTPGPMLAHKGYREGEVAAEVIAGRASAFDVRCIPAVIFSDPEIATVGMSESEARVSGRDFKVGKFPFAANGRALTSGDSEGFVKVIVAEPEHEILGVGIVGPHASDVIVEAGLAIEMGAHVPDLALTIHAHPTLPETLVEAARAAIGDALHVLAKR